MYPVVTICGPRQSGKTTLAKHLFPTYDYVSMEDPGKRLQFENDPRGFLALHPAPCIFDEVQNSFKNDPNFLENKKMEVKVSLLTQYLESGQWLRDFELDEKGKLPSGLKRGILSEDGLYNLIADIEQAKRKKSGLIGKIRKIFGL